MPAIQLPRLRRQAAELAEHFHKPSAFALELKYLLEFYADRTRRPGKKNVPSLSVKMFNVPDPVLRRVFLEINALAESDSKSAFALVETLWEEPIFELRLLATWILGAVPASDYQQIFSLLETWVAENEEEGLLNSMADQSLARIRAETPDTFSQEMETWVASEERQKQKLALRALLAHLRDPDFENLPVIYRLLGLHLPTASKAMRPYLLDLSKPLAQRSPQETAFFLRQHLENSDNQVVTWLVRRSIDFLPQENQESLKAALKGKKK